MREKHWLSRWPNCHQARSNFSMNSMRLRGSEFDYLSTRSVRVTIEFLRAVWCRSDGTRTKDERRRRKVVRILAPRTSIPSLDWYTNEQFPWLFSSDSVFSTLHTFFLISNWRLLVGGIARCDWLIEFSNTSLNEEGVRIILIDRKWTLKHSTANVPFHAQVSQHSATLWLMIVDSRSSTELFAHQLAEDKWKLR